MTTITKTKGAAIIAAKKELRMELGVIRLRSVVSNKHFGAGPQCDCGETAFVSYTGQGAGKTASVVVGYCNVCGE